MLDFKVAASNSRSVVKQRSAVNSGANHHALWLFSTYGFSVLISHPVFRTRMIKKTGRKMATSTNTLLSIPHCLTRNRFFQLFGEACVIMKDICSPFPCSLFIQEGLCLLHRFFHCQMDSILLPSPSLQMGF